MRRALRIVRMMVDMMGRFGQWPQGTSDPQMYAHVIPAMGLGLGLGNVKLR